MLNNTRHQENAKQNHKKIPLHVHQNSWLLNFKKKETNKYPQGYRKIRAFLLCWQECKVVQGLEKVLWFLKKLNIKLLYDPVIAFLGIFSTELKVGTRTDLFTLLQHYLQLKCPSDERIYKILYVHKTEYYFNLKECNSDTCYNIDRPQ